LLFLRAVKDWRTAEDEKILAVKGVF
jgi:hypothetical protein